MDKRGITRENVVEAENKLFSAQLGIIPHQLVAVLEVPLHAINGCVEFKMESFITRRQDSDFVVAVQRAF